MSAKKEVDKDEGEKDKGKKDEGEEDEGEEDEGEEDEGEEDSGEKEEVVEVVDYNTEEGKSKWGKISLTVVIAASYVCLACYRSIPGPTIMTMASMANATTTSIPIIFTMRSIGYVIGFLSGGLFLDKVKGTLYRQFLIIAVTVLMAVTAIGIAFCKNLVHLGSTFLAVGIFLSILELCLNIYMLQMWQGESPRYYQGLHFFYAVGYLIGPVIATMFLDDAEGGTDVPKIKMLNLNEMPRLIYAYVILCIMLLCVAAMWFVICILHVGFVKTVKIKSSLLKEPDDKFRMFAVISTAFLMFLVGCIELGYQHMLATFAFTKHGVSHVHSAEITTMFWAFFVMGSLGTIIISGTFHPHCLIITNNTIELLAGILLIFLVHHSNSYLALGNCILGLGASTLFPNTILWFDSYTTITHKTMGIFLCSTSLAEMVIPEILGAVLETSHRSLSYFVILIPLMYLTIFLVQCILFYPTGEKYPTNFDKPGQKVSRRRFCPIFMFKKIKTEEEKEDAEAPPDVDESDEGIADDTPDSEANDKKSNEKSGKKSEGKSKKSKIKAAFAKDPEDEEADSEDEDESSSRKSGRRHSA